MNVLKACEILELPENYDDVQLKKNYRSLAMKYHPDKNKTDTNEKFTEINLAHEYLLKYKPEKVENVFNNLFKKFTTFDFKSVNVNKFKQENLINMTIKEYIIGTTKLVPVKKNCMCEKQLCKECAGCGFSINLKTCMNCLGEGYIQNCVLCKNGTICKNKPIIFGPKPKMEIFDPLIGRIKINIEDPYFIRDSKIYCKFNISLKESLIGFNKKFIDPFGNIHNVIVNNVVKSNDGYQVIGEYGIILVFNVIYPKKLDLETIEKLKIIDF